MNLHHRNVGGGSKGGGGRKREGEGGPYLIEHIDHRVAVHWVECCYGDAEVAARGEPNLGPRGLTPERYVTPSDRKLGNHASVQLCLEEEKGEEGGRRKG